jgi:hypothetical protein
MTLLDIHRWILSRRNLEYHDTTRARPRISGGCRAYLNQIASNPTSWTRLVLGDRDRSVVAMDTHDAFDQWVTNRFPQGTPVVCHFMPLPTFYFSSTHFLMLHCDWCVMTS